MITELHYYAAARNDGWSFGDEDTAREYCESSLTAEDVANADTEFWRDEFNWWKAKP